MKSVLHFIFICLLFFAFGCKKDTDIISTETIHGQVYNICNDSGLANIPVYLQENGSNIAQTVSGVNGNFSFTNVKVHSAGAYSYAIYIYWHGAASPAIDGASVPVPNFPTTLNYVVKVMPRLYDWRIYCPNTTFLPTDTFSVVFQQNILHNNLSNPNNNIWTVSETCPCTYGATNYLGSLSNFPAGMWQVTLRRTKNGVHTLQTDSFYVGWGATQTDTLFW
jgi:hypothetical protein